MGINDKIYNATKWSAITNILSKITPPITNMILARLLTPEAFGVVATINMVITFADIFADAGFQKYLVQHNFDDEEALYKSANVAFWTNFSISTFLWLIIFILKDNISAMVGSDGYGIHLSVAAFSIPLIAFSSIQQAIYKRNFDFKGMFLPKLIRSFVPLVVTVPIAYFYRNCWALIIGTLAANFSDALLLTIRSKWKPKFFYKFSLLKEMFSFSAWTLLETLAIWLTTSIDVFIIGKVLSQYYLGLYKTSLTTVEQITTLITTTIVPVLFATLSRFQDDDEQFKKMFYSFQQKCAILLVPLSIGIFVFKELVTDILLGSQWVEAATFISLLGLIQFVRILLCYFASEVYRAKGQPKISFFVQIIYIVILIPVVYFSSRKGFECLYQVRILTYILFAFMHLLVLKFRFSFKIFSMLKTIISPLFASLIMGAVGYILLLWKNSLLFQILFVFICMLVYFILCLCFKDTRATLKSFIPKHKTLLSETQSMDKIGE